MQCQILPENSSRLVLDYKNQAIAEVTTAAPMDEQQLNRVRQALERNTGKTILMQTKVQPEILGGVVARVGDQVIDGSIRHRLATLKQQLLTGVAIGANDLSGLDGISETPVSLEGEPSSIQ